MTYGTQVVTKYQRDRDKKPDIVGEVTTSPSGNLILRMGRLLEMDEGHWEKTGHIVMTPDEAESFIQECQQALANNPRIESLERAVTEGDPK